MQPRYYSAKGIFLLYLNFFFFFFFLQTARKGLNAFFVFCLFFLNVYMSFRGVFQKPFKTFEGVNHTPRIDNEFMLNHGWQDSEDTNWAVWW